MARAYSDHVERELKPCVVVWRDGRQARLERRSAFRGRQLREHCRDLGVVLRGRQRGDGRRDPRSQHLRGREAVVRAEPPHYREVCGPHKRWEHVGGVRGFREEASRFMRNAELRETYPPARVPRELRRLVVLRQIAELRQEESELCEAAHGLRVVLVECLSLFFSSGALIEQRRFFPWS